MTGPPLRILVTNCQLDQRTGTEIVVRDLVLGLRAEGDDPVVYSPRHGELVEELAAAGIEVVAQLDHLRAPDLIHGHHHLETALACARFPAIPALFVCHDSVSPTDIPPPLPSILRYVAVDLNCRQRMTEAYGIPENRLELVLNAVDLDRFASRAALPARPRRALIFSNYAAPGSHLEPVREACGRIGLEVDVLGEGAGTAVRAPEAVLGDYDLVFAKARCALEALAVGAAVVLCGAEGLGPMVEAHDVAALRQWNFGARVLTRPLDAERIAAEMARYNPEDAAAVSGFIRRSAGLRDWLASYRALHQRVLEEWAQLPPAAATGGWPHYVRQMLDWLNRRETEWRARRENVATSPLAEDTIGACEIRFEECPRAVAAGQRFSARVRLRNGSGEVLRSEAPFPVQLAYRWLDDSGSAVPAEELRSRLPRPLASGEGTSAFIAVRPPGQAGEYRLRVTLVQEWVRWWDSVSPPVMDEARVRVEA